MGFLNKLLQNISGAGDIQLSEQLIFDKVVGFRNVVPGCGCSTIVQNVAIALASASKSSICIVDTNMLYPMLYAYLVDSQDEQHGKDIYDFNIMASEVTTPTKYSNIYLTSFKNRTVIDMMSSRDSEQLVEKLINSLKSFFDIILVDLSYELTSVAIHSAVRCNKIFNVTDMSLRAMYNLKKSINTMSTMAVPLAKADRVILNKVVPDMVVNANSALSEAGLKIVGEIPLSLEISKAGVTGASLYGASNDVGVNQFNVVIDTIVDDILQKTPLNTGAVTTNMLIKESMVKYPEMEDTDLTPNNTSSDSAVADDEEDIEIIK